MFQVIQKTAQAEFMFVNYFGQIFAVPVTHIHIFTTSAGDVKASPYLPTALEYEGREFWSTDDLSLTVGKIMYTGDWRQSKVTVNPNIRLNYFAIISLVSDLFDFVKATRKFNYFGFVFKCELKHGTMFATSPSGIVSLYKKAPDINDDGSDWKTKYKIGEVAKIEYVGDWKRSIQPLHRVG